MGILLPVLLSPSSWRSLVKSKYDLFPPIPNTHFSLFLPIFHPHLLVVLPRHEAKTTLSFMTISKFHPHVHLSHPHFSLFPPYLIHMILKTYPPKFKILNDDYALKLSNYTLWKRFICLKWIRKNLSTILHTQFNHHTMPVTSFSMNYLFTLQNWGFYKQCLSHFCFRSRNNKKQNDRINYFQARKTTIFFTLLLRYFNWTVSIISSNPPWENYNAWFTTVPLNP